ncbi:hypothetical protein HAX54_026945 [Datura stramonium]|uniref:Uncharacterized protein n=1 Tax=Datura stramonium TaxID=4076 RepID=A0ABS8S8C0_DATST|nr:hypothetical protein [Datura stramonium]
MEEVYISFKEKRFIHAEGQFDAESFKTAYLDIYHQIATRDWGPFTTPIYPYLTELMWEIYASYRSRQQLLKHRSRTESFRCLTSPLDRTVQANSVITLATKIDKEAPVMKWEKHTGNMTPPPPSTSIHTAAAQIPLAESHNSPPPDFLNIA